MMGAMRRFVVAIAVPAAVLALGACGTDQAGPPSAGPPSAGPSSSGSPGTGSPGSGPSGTGSAGTGSAGTSPTGPSTSASVFPLTLVRAGGIVGFSDRVTIESDGTVTVSRRGRTQPPCRLDAGLRQQIVTAAAGVDWKSLGRATSSSPTVADALVVSVSARGGTARVGQPEVADLQEPLTRLLADVSLPPDKRTLCTPMR